MATLTYETAQSPESGPAQYWEIVVKSSGVEIGRLPTIFKIEQVADDMVATLQNANNENNP